MSEYGEFVDELNDVYIDDNWDDYSIEAGSCYDDQNQDDYLPEDDGFVSEEARVSYMHERSFYEDSPLPPVVNKKHSSDVMASSDPGMHTSLKTMQKSTQGTTLLASDWSCHNDLPQALTMLESDQNVCSTLWHFGSTKNKQANYVTFEKPVSQKLSGSNSLTKVDSLQVCPDRGKLKCLAESRRLRFFISDHPIDNDICTDGTGEANHSWTHLLKQKDLATDLSTSLLWEKQRMSHLRDRENDNDSLQIGFATEVDYSQDRDVLTETHNSHDREFVTEVNEIDSDSVLPSLNSDDQVQLEMSRYCADELQRSSDAIKSTYPPDLLKPLPAYSNHNIVSSYNEYLSSSVQSSAIVSSYNEYLSSSVQSSATSTKWPKHAIGSPSYNMSTDAKTFWSQMTLQNSKPALIGNHISILPSAASEQVKAISDQQTSENASSFASAPLQTLHGLPSNICAKQTIDGNVQTMSSNPDPNTEPHSKDKISAFLMSSVNIEEPRTLGQKRIQCSNMPLANSDVSETPGLFNSSQISQPYCTQYKQIPLVNFDVTETTHMNRSSHISALNIQKKQIPSANPGVTETSLLLNYSQTFNHYKQMPLTNSGLSETSDVCTPSALSRSIKILPFQSSSQGTAKDVTLSVPQQTNQLQSSKEPLVFSLPEDLSSCSEHAELSTISLTCQQANSMKSSGSHTFALNKDTHTVSIGDKLNTTSLTGQKVTVSEQIFSEQVQVKKHEIGPLSYCGSTPSEIQSNSFVTNTPEYCKVQNNSHSTNILEHYKKQNNGSATYTLEWSDFHNITNTNTLNQISEQSSTSQSLRDSVNICSSQKMSHHTSLNEFMKAPQPHQEDNRILKSHQSWHGDVSLKSHQNWHNNTEFATVKQFHEDNDVLQKKEFSKALGLNLPQRDDGKDDYYSDSSSSDDDGYCLGPLGTESDFVADIASFPEEEELIDDNNDEYLSLTLMPEKMKSLNAFIETEIVNPGQVALTTPPSDQTSVSPTTTKAMETSVCLATPITRETSVPVPTQSEFLSSDETRVSLATHKAMETSLPGPPKHSELVSSNETTVCLATPITRETSLPEPPKQSELVSSNKTTICLATPITKETSLPVPPIKNELVSSDKPAACLSIPKGTVVSFPMHLPSVPQHAISLPMSPIQEQTWEELNLDRSLFEQTSAFKDSLFILKEKFCVILVGSIGCGKYTLGKALMRYFRKENCRCHIIKSFEEWRNNIGAVDSGNKEVVMLRHIFGKMQFDTNSYQHWKDLFPQMLARCEKGNLLLIFIMYKYILQQIRDQDQKLFCTMSEVSLDKLTENEKEKILHKHLQKVGKNYLDYKEVISDIVKKDILHFPKLCFLWASKLDHKGSGVHDIFVNPRPLYEEYFSLALQTSNDPEKLVAAFCVLYHSPTLTCQDVKSVCDLLGFSSFTPFQLKEVLQPFLGLRLIDKNFQFANRYVYEGAAQALGKKHLEHMLQVVDVHFLVQRCVVPCSRQYSKKATTLAPVWDFQLQIKRVTNGTKSSVYQKLVERLVNELKKTKDMVPALQHPVLQFQQFLEDIAEKCASESELLHILSETVDIVHQQTALYWSLFNSLPDLSCWIFKKVYHLKGRYQSKSLILMVSACCVLRDKTKMLKVLLKNWKKCTKERDDDMESLLNGIRSTSMHLPIPDKDVCFSDSWLQHLDSLQSVSQFIIAHKFVSLTGLGGFEDEGMLTATQQPELLHGEIIPYSLPNSESILNSSLPTRSPSHSTRLPSAGKSNYIDISLPPLHLAVMYNNVETVQFLMENYPDTLKNRDCHKRTVLHLAAYFGHTDLVQMFIDIDEEFLCSTSLSGNTPLHEACQSGHLAAVQILLKKNPDLINSRNRNGQTALLVATASTNHELVDFLLDRGANGSDKDIFGNTQLHIACCYHGNIKLLEKLLSQKIQKNFIDARNSKQNTPLHLACHCHDNKEIVQVLINKGANVNARNENNSTPLHMAAHAGHLNIVRTLLHEDADISAKDDRGRIPGSYGSDKVKKYLQSKSEKLFLKQLSVID